MLGRSGAASTGRRRRISCAFLSPLLPMSIALNFPDRAAAALDATGGMVGGSLNVAMAVVTARRLRHRSNVTSPAQCPLRCRSAPAPV